MRIAVTGASGLIGSALVPVLRSAGHDVVRLVRRTAAAADEVAWDPTVGAVDTDAMAGVDGVVHLAGAGIGDHRWTDDYKRTILDSRVQGTRTIATAMTALDPLPRVLVSGSAIGWYGDTGDTAVDETAPQGRGFLADVVAAWEAAAAPAVDAGIRVAYARTGLVMSRRGGALGRLLPLARLGLAGRLGSGRQYWSFISLADEVAALRFLLEHDVAGPVNLTAPDPVTNATVTDTLGELLHRPTVLPVPRFALKVAVGEFAQDVLDSQRVRPAVLQREAFDFAHPTIAAALRAALEGA